MKELKGAIALVTVRGSGLGRAVCKTLAAAEVIVITADIRLELAEETIRELGPSAAGLPLRLDVACEEQAKEAIEQILSRYGRLDILVNNAGIDVTVPIEELSVAEWNRIIGVNLSGPFIMSKYALPQMKNQGQGHIANIISTAAKRAWANAAADHASKWGLLGMIHAFHVEARPHNMKVTAVINGGMRTPFLLDRLPDIAPNVLQDPANVAETIRFVLTQPDETVIPEVMVLPMRETSWP
ncbi:MAG: SDR family oxidoreductase [Dehalococcoidia bacterium]